MTDQLHDVKSIMILRLKQVSERTGLSRSAIYEKMDPRSPRHDPTFPSRIPLGKGAVGWNESDVQRWLASCVYASDAPNKDLRSTVMPKEAKTSAVRIEQLQPSHAPQPVSERLATPSEIIEKEKATDRASALRCSDAAPIQTLDSTKSLTDQVSRPIDDTPQVLAASTPVIKPTSIVTNSSDHEADIEKLCLADARQLVAEFEKKCIEAVGSILEDYARRGVFVFYDEVMKAINLSPASADDCALFDKILENISRASFSSRRIILSAIVRIPISKYKDRACDAFIRVANSLLTDRDNFSLANEQVAFVQNYYSKR